MAFYPGEITPKEANRIGYELAMRWTKGRHAFLVTTHTDKKHIHCHIYYNSTSLDCSRKFRNFWGSSFALRRLSDRLCLENGLSIVENPKPRSQSKVCRFFSSVTKEQTIGFLDDWNKRRDHKQRIYISYDSSNKNCNAGDIELIEYGKAKDDKAIPIFNLALAFDKTNRVPLFYEEYPGSITDVSQFVHMVDKVTEYGYKKVGFILDRGYFSKDNTWFAFSFRMVCRNFILPEFCKPCLFLSSFQFAKLIVPYPLF